MLMREALDHQPFCWMQERLDQMGRGESLEEEEEEAEVLE
jgi:hypothetical protein